MNTKGCLLHRRRSVSISEQCRLGGSLLSAATSARALTRTRQGRVCSADMANVLEFGAFWREFVVRVHADEYPDVELSHMYVDNYAMQLVGNPSPIRR